MKNTTNEPKGRYGFKRLPMPEWWDDLGRVFRGGNYIVAAHPEHEPCYWWPPTKGWIPIKTVSIYPHTPMIEVDADRLFFVVSDE